MYTASQGVSKLIFICQSRTESQYILTMWKENCQDKQKTKKQTFLLKVTVRILHRKNMHWLNLLNLFKTCSVENNLTRKLNNITAMRQRISAVAYHRILSVLHYPRQSQFSPIFQPDCFLARSVTVWRFRATNFHHRIER